MHDSQYRDYKSGVAKKRFLEELERMKDASFAKKGYDPDEILKIKHEKADPIIADARGQILYEVSVDGPSIEPYIGRKYKQDEQFCILSTPWGSFDRYLSDLTVA